MGTGNSLIDYEHTAQRPEWEHLPEQLRSAINDRLGGRVTGAVSRTSGFSDGFASVLTTAERGSYFIKATSATSSAAQLYRAEARFAAALPAAVPAPKFLWSAELAGHVVLCFVAVVGRTPKLPWSTDELRAALRAQTAVAASLADPPARLADLVTTSFSETARDRYGNWAAIAAGQVPMPDVPSWASTQLGLLISLEAQLPELTNDATSLIHYDMRADNLLVLNRYSWTLVTDWAWVMRGPSWVDTVALLIGASDRADVDELLAGHPTAAAIPARGVEAMLAAYAGYLLVHGSAEPDPASPYLAQHRRQSGLAALGWLRRRLDH
ncbi:phosphotransferase [Catellatospora citrea]|uniref:phosphotransferase n=1 Tax=Catellatospora citrea TaxID=53366 RepID=UPI0033C95FF7